MHLAYFWRKRRVMMLVKCCQNVCFLCHHQSQKIRAAAFMKGTLSP
jgi:hypothetical protein